MKDGYESLTEEQKAEVDRLLDSENVEVKRCYTFDDTGNAQRFFDKFGLNFRYNYVKKSWYYWNGKFWELVNDDVIHRAINKSVDSMSDELKFYQKEDDSDMEKNFSKHIKYSRSNKGKVSCKKEIMPLLPVTQKELDRHKWAFNCTNGIISLKNGHIVPHSRDYMITRSSDVEFDPNADCPVWRKFLCRIFGGDAEIIRYVQKSIGYSMSGDVGEQCAFFLYGNGRNGKSTFIEAIRGVMGSYAANIQPESIMKKNYTSSANSDIARLNSVRFVSCGEPDGAFIINEGLIKQLTGGDPVTARRLYENEFEFIPEFKLWIATNHKPIIRGTDDGIWRRVRLIPFTVQIPESEIDKALPDKLKVEYPGILNWMFQGFQMWMSEGLKTPSAIQHAVDDYRREMDVVSAFIDECCELSDGAFVKAAELFQSYSQWADANKEYGMGHIRFGTEISKRFQKIKNRDGIFYIGIKLV